MSGEVWEELYERLATLILAHRTTLVFVNTRRMVERVCRHLGERVGNEHVSAHHGSLSREQRLSAEQRLKSGQLRALVATASLELGIDIGAIDLVCQVGSSRSITTLLQRVGRSGHKVGGFPKGKIFPLSRDELVECAALLDSIRRGELDRLSIPEQPLDILAQHIVAAVSCGEWTEDALYRLVCSAYPYRHLARADFDSVVHMLADGFSTRLGRRGTYVHHDRVNQRLRGRRGARLAAITSGGAIPDSSDYDVILEPAGTFVGTVNEDFAVESLAGDIFQLGNTSWRILRVEPGRVRVEDARGQPPSIPFWFGEAPGRSTELSAAVSRLRTEVAQRLIIDDTGSRLISAGQSCGSGSLRSQGGAGIEECLPPDRHGSERALTWLREEVGISPAAAEQIVSYLASSQAALGVIPSQQTLVLERFFDESGGMQMVVHSPFGSRLNRAWGLALRKRFCRKFNFELQAAATEDAIVLSLGHSHSFPLTDVFSYLRSDSVRDLLVQALLDAPMFTIRWRWNVTRALGVLRWRGGHKVAPQLQRMKAEDLLAAIFPDQLACAENLSGEREVPDHPLVRETIRDCLEEAMDVQGFEGLLASIERHEKTLVARDLVEPSPLAAEILTARPYAFLDDAPLEERRTQAVYSRRWLDPETAADLGTLSLTAIDRVREEAWPQVGDADELHDALLQLGFLTEEEGLRGNVADREGWAHLLDRLVAERRATRLQTCQAGPTLWVAAERLPQLGPVFPGGSFRPAILAPENGAVSSALAEHDGRPLNRDSSAGQLYSFEDALVELLRSRLEGIGPATAAQLAASASLSLRSVESALQRLEAEGFILRGHFTPGTCEIEWCARRLLARIHRYTLDKLRSEIEPVASADFIRFLFSWQRVEPDRRAEGPTGLAGLLDQLEGFEAAAAAWEGEILPARLAKYDPAWLDGLCLSGQLVWARLTPPKQGPQKGSGFGPIRSTPIVLLNRKNLPTWNRLSPQPNPEEIHLSLHAQMTYDHLLKRGASFFVDLVEGTGLLQTQVENGLGELVGWGLVSADSYTGLRALLTPSNKRPPLSKGTRGSSVTVFGMENAGRWARLSGEIYPGLDERSNNGPSKHQEGRSHGPDPEVVETLSRVLLRRYGVIFRRLLEREAPLLPWREMLKVFRRLEARGEIRGGRFVAGFSGEQFALPDAVGTLRSIRRTPSNASLVSVSASDPLNLVGILTPGSRVPPVSANRILYRDGVPIAIREAGQVRFLLELDPASEWQIRNALVRRSVPPQLRAYLGQPV
jgi:ATP-dependent helicase Lhr and Lhr-like helicase